MHPKVPLSETAKTGLLFAKHREKNSWRKITMVPLNLVGSILEISYCHGGTQNDYGAPWEEVTCWCTTPLLRTTSLGLTFLWKYAHMASVEIFLYWRLVEELWHRQKRHFMTEALSWVGPAVSVGYWSFSGAYKVDIYHSRSHQIQTWILVNSQYIRDFFQKNK